MADFLPEAFVERSSAAPVVRLDIEREIGSRCAVTCLAGYGLEIPEMKETPDGHVAITTINGCAKIELKSAEVGPPNPDNLKKQADLHGNAGGIKIVNPLVVCPANPASVRCEELTERLGFIMKNGNHSASFTGLVDLALLGIWLSWLGTGESGLTPPDLVATGLIIRGIELSLNGARTLARPQLAYI